jgi:hypothetical protein
MADRERVTFALIERYGESVNCNRWGRILVRAGAAIGPLLNPDGTLFQYSAPAAVERGAVGLLFLWSRSRSTSARRSGTGALDERRDLVGKPAAVLNAIPTAPSGMVSLTRKARRAD